MSQDIPQWAKERACELVNAKTAGMMDYTPSAVAGHNPSIFAFAAYIATHEEPPVDPLLVEAREIVATTKGYDVVADEVRSGDYDPCLVAACLTALRRGIELGRPTNTGEAV